MIERGSNLRKKGVDKIQKKMLDRVYRKRALSVPLEERSVEEIHGSKV